MKNKLLKKSMAILMTLAMVISLLPTMTIFASAAVPATQVLNSSWKTDTANGFSEPTASVVATNIKYDDTIWLNSASYTEWIEFSADSGEGLEAFDLTSFTLGKYQDATITLDFTITGTKKSGGTPVTKDFTWPSGSNLTKTFSGDDFSTFTQITKFKITLQNVSKSVLNIEFRDFAIENQTGSGNTPPVISGLSDATYQENDVNANYLQIDSDVAVTDGESADFDGGQVSVSYSGTPLPEDQLSVGNVGNISLSGTAVNYSSIGQIGTVSSSANGANGASLTIALNDKCTPTATSALLKALTYKNTSNVPTSQRTISVTVSDGDGGTSTAAMAKISVSGQSESGVENPPLNTQDINTDWPADLNNGFTIQGNDGGTLGSDATSIWNNGNSTDTASYNIAAGEQFAGGKFDITGLTFDVADSGKTYTVTIIGHKPNGSTVSASQDGSSKAALAAIDLNSITGIVSFDFQVTEKTTNAVSNVGLDTFTIANPGTAGIINTEPVISGLSNVTYSENTVNANYQQIDADVAVTDGDSTDFDGGQVSASYSGTPLPEDQLSVGNVGNISLSGTAVNYTGIGQIGTIVSDGVNGASLTIALNANATPTVTSALLQALAYKNTSNGPTSNRTISVTVSDGDGGTSSAATATISVSGQAESGVENPSSNTQDINIDWPADLNDGFTMQAKGGAILFGNSTSIWINTSSTATASFNIAAGEQFAGGKFDLTGMTFDVPDSGKTYTVTIIGYKADGSTVTASKTGDSNTTLAAIVLSSITGIVSFDFQVTAPTAGGISGVGLDSFTIANPGTASSSDAGLTSIAGKTDTTPGTETGADKTHAISWGVDVAYAKATIGLSDVIAATNATINLYSDSGLLSEITGTNTIALTSGDTTTVYIKVTAQDTTTIKYYAVTVNRAAPPPTVTLSVDVSSVNEAAGVATFSATLSAVSALPVTVTLGFTGTAIGGGNDYTASGITITIPAGSTTGTVTITASGGSIDEPDETVIVDITGVTNGMESGTQQQTATITDDDPEPTISVNDPSATEGNAGTVSLTFTVTLSSVSGKTITVDYATANGSATSGTDYTAIPTTALTFAAGETTKTVAVVINGDTVTEPNETVRLNLTNASNASVSDSQGIGTITNDDAVPAISIDDASLAEGNTGTQTYTFTASLNHASSSEVTVNFATGNNTAASGEDYTAITTDTLTFAAGETSKTISVTVIGDTTYEATETFYLNLSSSSGATINDAQGLGTITNDDTQPAVTLSVDNASISENGGSSIVTATLSNASYQDLTVTLGFTGTATNVTDFTKSGTTITIAAGSTTGTATITATADSIDEDDETVIVDITSVTNGTESGTQQRTVTITDDDAAPTISIDDPTITEGDAGTVNLTFTVTLSTASGKIVTVDYATSDGTATTADNDYVSKSGTITFAPGVTSRDFMVTINGDTVNESSETVLLNLTNPSNVTIADTQGSGTITNDDGPPLISIGDVTHTEGNAGTQTYTFTVSLNKASASTVTVDYATADNTALSGEDYTAISLTKLTFTPGQITKTVDVTVTGDTKYETDKSYYVNLSNVLNASIDDAQGVGTISNDDAQPTVTLSVDNASINENGGSSIVTATLSNASYQDVTVTLGFSGTATNVTDYIKSGTTITITAGSTTGAATITATAESIDEVDETVVVDITGVTNGTESGTQQKTVTVTDDDAEPTVSINDPSLAEGNSGTSNLVFTVTLSAASGKEIKLNYQTADGTATAGTDYTAVSGMLTFVAGETSKTITVLVNGDTTAEANETILINLSSPVNASIPDTQGTGTSTDDDTVTGGGSSSDSSSATLIINGQTQTAGTKATSTNSSGQTVTTITVDDAKMGTILEKSGDKPTITLPGGTGADSVVGELSGQTIKNMEKKEAVLEIKTDSVTYTLPASEINIDDISAMLGLQVSLKDIKVRVSIAEPSADTARIVRDTANRNSYQLVVKPVEFEVSCTSGGKTVAVSKFNGYVERTVAIPDGVDPSKITTGIVLNADGSFSHVPTSIVAINGKYFAKINSLTNSTYSVIYNPVTFTDVSSHWAKDAINDMGSKMVVTGMGNGTYEPERSITRAEFATIVVRALGLQKGTTESDFGDVALTDWFNGYVDTATAYSLINGYDSATYGPNDTITREQAMTILARAMKLTDLSVSLTDSEVSATLANYTDGASVSSYAKTSVAICVKSGVVTGSSATTLSPKAYVTRAEVAVMAQRMLQKAGLI